MASRVPDIGRSGPIAEVTASELLGVLKAIERRGLLDTVRRVRQQASRILRHAVGLGRTPYDLTEDLRGLLLPPITRHHPGITNPKRLGELLRAMEAYTGAQKIGIALKLTPLLFVRPSELRHAEWGEIDFERAQWRIPAERMKMRAPHIVPLCRQALELLGRLQVLTGAGRYLFPAHRKQLIDFKKEISMVPGRDSNAAQKSFSYKHLADSAFRVTLKVTQQPGRPPDMP